MSQGPEWANSQVIYSVVIGDLGQGIETHQVGRNDGQGVTRIEACTKSGMYADIPYVRVWAGEDILAEYCQHNIIGVTFAPGGE